MIIGGKTLFPHQVRAVEWMTSREEDPESSHGGFLCDDMGLGKTWSVLGLICSTAKECPRTLLLCPIVLIDQWTKGAISSGLNVYHYPATHQWTPVNRQSSSNASIYIANSERIKEYESIVTPFDRLVIDEAHILRNGKSKRYDKIYNLAKEIPRTWCLSGTPLVNRLQDVEALYRLICGNKKEGTIRCFSDACHIMGMSALRRSMEDINLPLGPRPDDKEIILDFDTDTEATFYRMIQGQLKRQLEIYEQFDARNSTAMFILLLRLRQISIHPQIYIEGQRRSHGVEYTRANWQNKSSTKVNGLLDLLRTQPQGHNWVVFCNFQDEIEIIRQLLLEQPYIGTVSTYHGKKKIDERSRTLQTHKEACERNTNVPYSIFNELSVSEDIASYIYSFIKPIHNVMLVQIHCGGTGLNLQENDRVVFMSPWWTSALMKQAVGRVYRMGQQKTVQVYRIMLKEEASLNIDKIMMSKAMQKEDLCEELLNHCAK